MISLVDTIAAIASIVDAPLPAPDRAAGDSYDVLPTWLDMPHDPIRPDMIDHSNDGYFAIRQGPWKYIEGQGARPVKGKDGKLGPKTMPRELYNLSADPGETRNVVADHPKIVARLQGLLDRQREQGFSREPAASRAAR